MRNWKGFWNILIYQVLDRTYQRCCRQQSTDSKSLIVFYVSATESEVAQSNWQQAYCTCASAFFNSGVCNETTSWVTTRDYSTQHSGLRQLHHVGQVQTDWEVWQSNCVIQSASFPIPTIAKFMCVLSKRLKISVPLTKHGPPWVRLKFQVWQS